MKSLPRDFGRNVLSHPPAAQVSRAVISRSEQIVSTLQPVPFVTSQDEHHNNDATGVQSSSAESAAVPAALTARAVKRYQDAYVIALSLNEQGQTIKSLAALAAMIIVIVSIVGTVAAANINGGVAVSVLVVGIIAAGMLWSVIHGNGVRVAASGQQLLATLDIAVHTSPFMSNSDRAQAMSL